MDGTWIDVSDTNVSFKHLCSPVAPITDPWKCVVYKDICLLKAHSSSRRFSSNCVGDAAPKRFSGCGFVLTIIRHTSARGPICAMHMVRTLIQLLYTILTSMMCIKWSRYRHCCALLRPSSPTLPCSCLWCTLNHSCPC